MKFRHSAATIAIYFLFTLLWMALFINASEDKTKDSIPELDNENSTKPSLYQKHKLLEEKWKIFYALLLQKHKLQQNTLAQKALVNTVWSLDSISKNILSKILNEFLTIHDILILRQISRAFQILLLPNDKTTDTFHKNFGSKKMGDVPLIWPDLKYFRHQSFANALENVEILNLKQNLYAIFTRDKKVISWYKEQASNVYDKMILNKIKNGTYQMSDDPNWGVKIPEPVKTIIFNYDAFATLLEDGSVIAWGDPYCGGKIPERIQTQLKNVKTIFSTEFAFAALLHDGSVVAWGNEGDGAKIPEPIQAQLKNVETIFSTDRAFAALLHDGSVVAWGDEESGGEIPEPIQAQLKNVKTIFSTQYAFAALLHDGSVFAWGRESKGGKIPTHIQTQLNQNVKMIFSNDGAFVALLNNDRFVAWGDESCGGKITNEIQTQLKNFSKGIFSSSSAFAALLNDGNVFTWGNPLYGGKIPDEVKSQLMNNVEMILPKKYGFNFTAISKNNKMISW